MSAYRLRMTILLVMLYVILALAVVLVFEGIWNYLMPYLFDVPTINYLQAFLLLVMVSILNGSLISFKISK